MAVVFQPGVFQPTVFQTLRPRVGGVVMKQSARATLATIGKAGKSREIPDEVVVS